jgi:hypothetical protein
MATLNVQDINLDTFSAKYNARYEKVDGDLQTRLCIVCGRTVGDNGSFIWLINGGTTIASADETNVDESGDMGWWQIGSECIKSVPENFRIKM